MSESITHDKIFIALSNDLYSGNIHVIHVSYDYNECLNKFHDSYEQYVKDREYICREVGKHDILVYKRRRGYLYDTKQAIMSYKLCEWSQ